MGNMLTTEILSREEIGLHTLGIKIRRFFTDVNGTIVDKNTVPANLQVSYPFYLFGKFDLDGGYRAAMACLPPDPNTIYLTTFINGAGYESANVVGFTGLDTIKNFIKIGDIVHVFTDSLNAPNYYIWICQTCDSAALGSIVKNWASKQNDERFGRLAFKYINYQSDNEDQFNQPIRISKVDNLGRYRYDDINPLIWKVPVINYQPNLIRVGFSLKTNQYTGINSYITFTSDSLILDFKLTKDLNPK